MTKERRAMLQMLCCAILWSLSGVFIKLIPWNPMAIMGTRCVFTVLVLYGYMRISRIRLLFNKKTVLLGICIVLIYSCYMPAVKRTTAANAILLQYTAPVYVLLYAAIFHKQRIKRSDLVAVLCVMAGMALFFLDGLGGGMLSGNVLALLSGIFLGGMFFIVADMTEQERYTGLLLGQMLAVVIGLPFFFITSPPVTAPILLYIIGLGVLQLGLPYILYIKAARYCPPLTCSLLSVIEPLLNPVWVLVAVGERPSVFALAGGAVVLSVITVWCVWGEKQNQKQQQAQDQITPAG